MPESHGLLERNDELARLTALVTSAAAGGGGLLIVEGEAGIGKSRLLQAARELAADRGVTALAARGGELEREFGYGVVRQLFERHLRSLPDDSRSSLLSGAAAPALSALGFAGPEVAGAPDASIVTEHALYWVAADLADRGPLLLCVDDGHWADLASLRWLIYLARRLEGVPIGVLVGWRTGEPGAPDHLLAALREPLEADALVPAALSEAACSVLVSSAVGAADPEFATACREVTGGNPFLLGELVQALEADGIAGADDAVDRVRSLGPAAVARSVLVRLSRLPPEAAALARALAVLDIDADLPHAARLAQIDDAQAVSALDALAAAHIVEPGGAPRFAHPILRTAVYRDLGDAARGHLHGLAARMLDERGEGDRAAVHLLATRPAGDPWVARCLRDAGARAVQRGAPDAAVALLRRALAEPPPAEARSPTLLTLGRAEQFAGDAAATARFEHALETARSPEDLAAAAREVGRAMLFAGRGNDAVALLEDVIARLGESERELRLGLEAELATLGVSVESETVRLMERLARQVPDASGETPAERALLAPFAMQIAGGRGREQEVVDVSARSWANGLLLRGDQDGVVAAAFLIVALKTVDHLARAWEIADRCVSVCRERGNVTGLALSLANRAWMEWRQGRVRAAAADAREALDLATLAGADLVRVYALAQLLFALARTGELDQADAVLSEHGYAERPPPTQIQTTLLLDARAEVRHLQGRPEDAARDAELHFSRAAGSGLSVQVELCRVLALALHQLGRTERAIEVCETKLAFARDKHITSDVAVMTGTIGLMRGDLGQLEEASRLLARSPRRLSEAQALLDYGAALRRGGQRADARDPLRRALDLAHACGGGTIERHAHEELLATGARPRRLVLSGADSLTASERRVAELAASGSTNREIAQTLFVTQKTVETHMRAILRKLDVPSRTLIGHALSGSGGEEELRLVALVAFDGASPVVVRRELDRHRAGEVGERMASFESPTRAVQCARAIREAGGEGVRVAVHVGECAVAGGALRGPAVEAVAALAATAPPGEVLLSDAVRALVGGAA